MAEPSASEWKDMAEALITKSKECREELEQTQASLETQRKEHSAAQQAWEKERVELNRKIKSANDAVADAERKAQADARTAESRVAALEKKLSSQGGAGASTSSSASDARHNEQKAIMLARQEQLREDLKAKNRQVELLKTQVADLETQLKHQATPAPAESAPPPPPPPVAEWHPSNDLQTRIVELCHRLKNPAPGGIRAAQETVELLLFLGEEAASRLETATFQVARDSGGSAPKQPLPSVSQMRAMCYKLQDLAGDGLDASKLPTPPPIDDSASNMKYLEDLATVLFAEVRLLSVIYTTHVRSDLQK